MTKSLELAETFRHLADLLAYQGENLFKIRAYRRAAGALEGLEEDVEALAAEGRLEEVPGIGKAIAGKIREYLHTGKMRKYEEALRGVPRGVAELLKLPGLGPRTVARMVDMGVADPEALRRALAEGRSVPGLSKGRLEEVKNFLGL